MKAEQQRRCAAESKVTNDNSTTLHRLSIATKNTKRCCLVQFILDSIDQLRNMGPLTSYSCTQNFLVLSRKSPLAQKIKLSGYSYMVYIKKRKLLAVASTLVKMFQRLHKNFKDNIHNLPATIVRFFLSTSRKY